MPQNYPEHDKLHAIADKSQAIGEFLEWLQDEKGYVIAEWSYDNLYVSQVVTQKLLAMYFDIDLEKIEEEKLAMLDEIRRAQPCTK